MELAIPKAVELKVRIHEPELVVPVKKTPHELKPLSDIDDQEGFRFCAPIIMLYENIPLMKGRDPVKVIRQALGQALVYYYPFAGRLVEGPNRKLLADCTGEGVLFIEADACVKLEQLGDTIHPPFPYLEELLHDVPGSSGIIGCPLLLIQITRFLCGGFVFALRLNHTMSDGLGLAQFLNAIADFAKGEVAPSVLPVWRREILSARSTPQITCMHHEYDQLIDTKGSLTNDNMVQRLFFFGSKEVKTIQNHIPPNQRTKFSSFELIVACVWRCRTIALRLDPDEIVRLSCFRNIRGKHIGLQLPLGYYGNAVVYPAAVSKAKMLCESSLEFPLELIREAKDRMNKEYVKSVADLMVSKGRPSYTKEGHFLVSDHRYLGLDKIDFGWSKPLFGGVSGAISFISCLLRFKSKNGVEGTLMPICLPLLAMKRFGHELQKMIQEPIQDLYVKSDPIITSKF